MKKTLAFSLLMVVPFSVNAEMKTENHLKHIDVKSLPTMGAVSAVKMAGRVHEAQDRLESALEAFAKGACDLAQVYTEQAHKLATRAAKLTAASAQSKVDTESAKAQTHPTYDEVKAAHPHPDDVQ